MVKGLTRLFGNFLQIGQAFYVGGVHFIMRNEMNLGNDEFHGFTLEVCLVQWVL
jgi:hypothetical protein